VWSEAACQRRSEGPGFGCAGLSGEVRQPATRSALRRQQRRPTTGSVLVLLLNLNAAAIVALRASQLHYTNLECPYHGNLTQPLSRCRPSTLSSLSSSPHLQHTHSSSTSASTQLHQNARHEG